MGPVRLPPTLLFTSPSSQILGSSQTRLLAIWEQMFLLPKITYIHLHLLRSVLEGSFTK